MKAILTTVLLVAAVGCPAMAQTGRELVESSGVRGGLIVCLEGADEIVLEELRVNDRYLVQGLFVDGNPLESERRRIQANGGYGPVSLRPYSGETLPYVDNLVNLIVAGDCGRLAPAEVYRVLAPNGVLLTKVPPKVDGLDFAAEPSEIKGWTKVVKNWPDGMGQWTHWLCGPDNNAVCADDMAAFPREMQWQQAPLWLKSHELIPALSAVVSAQGRLFYILDECAETSAGMGGMPERWQLIARDAFNGVELWKRPIAQWGTSYWMSMGKDGRRLEGGRLSQPPEVLRRLVAVGDKVFVTLGLFAPVSALDAATGEEIRCYEGTEKTCEIACRDGTLFLAVNPRLGTEVKRGEWSNEVVSIMAVDVETGEILWQSKGFGGVRRVPGVLPHHTSCTLTLGKKQIFLQDGEAIVALDLKTGEERWRFSLQAGVRNASALVYCDGLLFLSHPDAGKDKLRKEGPAPAVLTTVDAQTGEQRWSVESGTLAFGTLPDILINQGLVWILDRDGRLLVGLDVATGDKKKTIDATVIATGTHHNCYPNKASRNLLFYGRNKGVECFDFNTGEASVNKWVKGACCYGIMPANGMVYAPSHMCGCKADSKLNGIVALSNVSLQGKALSDAVAVTRGPAFGGKHEAATPAKPGDWPVYRGDMERRGFQAAPLADRLVQKWRCRPGGRLTPPIISGGKVFVAARDQHTVFGVDEKSGEVLWSYIAGGPIDSAPTWSAGRLVFGGRDGVVYCLDANSGELIWRFRAAPAIVQVMAFDQLESAWPVSGSLLVHDGKVYVPAGRSSMLGSGIALYMLDLETGAPLKSRWLDAAANADLLIGNGEWMTLRGVGLNMSRLDGKGRAVSFLKAYGGFLDDSWFNGAFWEYSDVKGIMLAMDTDAVYGIDTYRHYGWKSNAKPKFYPGKRASMLFASSERDVRTKTGGTAKRQTRIWAVPLPILAKAMAVGPEKVCVAGVRDIVDDSDPWTHIHGKMGAKLLVYSKADGTPQSEFELASPPVFDGMAAAHGSLFVSCRDGSVICLGK
jgi:outer membrane protein assembly factor BamB